ncbi:HD-GYP domain-containing protein [Shewanella saliphila]|uniref:Phosphodiesterase n=1 Tax=Shewanella saliphila TaxID=2282698 RepID=A0ABQ2Q920_9GAMM|nr:HD-GYP domain-containing protein [Shewanella saliphila]MCL1103080.1 HD-GYP domain-containing protein [Shewanella saliphila]GGP60077.1 phosphodiesterase [Shewanella saliphila]
MLIEHDITDVRVGMYVVEITEPKDTFTLTKPGVLKSERVIEALKRKSVTKLLIDTSKAEIIDEQTQPEVSRPTVKPPQQVPPARPITKPNFFNQEIVRARQVFNESKDIQKKLFHNAQHGLPLDMDPVQKITTESTDLIFNNPNALSCVINIRNKDEYLLEHSVSVSVLMTMFAVYKKIDKDIVNQLAVGAFLHDVGKIMIPDRILNKPDRLTEDEFHIMKTHASYSIEIMKSTPGISPLSLEVASLHHEKLNGEGYPFGVPAEKITIYGRMISICDIFDALTSHRCYKEGYAQVKAFSILRALADKNELDKDLVDEFIRCMGVYPVGSVVQLESNRLAIVQGHNPKDPIRPLVKPFYHLKPDHFEVSQKIDLATVTDDLIVKCVRADDYNLNMEQIIEFLAHEG